MKSLPALVITCLLIFTFFTGCANTHYQMNDKQKELAKSLTDITDDYLTKNIGKTGFGGKTFCMYKTLDIEETNQGLSEYLFAVCQEYYLNDGDLKEGTGISLPIALFLQKENQSYKVLRHKIPRDGSQNSHDIDALFPTKTHNEIYSLRSGSNYWRDELEKKASNYFQKSIKR